MLESQAMFIKYQKLNDLKEHLILPFLLQKLMNEAP